MPLKQRPVQEAGIKSKLTPSLIVALSIFLLGLFLALAFNIRVVWSSIEGMYYWGFPESIPFDPLMANDSSLTRLNCPLILSPDEQGTLELMLKNNGDRDSKPWLRVLVSDPDVASVIDTEMQQLVIRPSESMTVRHPLTLQNDFSNRLIKVRAFIYPSHVAIASETRNCAFSILRLGNLRGTQILGLAIGLIGTLLITGLALWQHFSTPAMKRSPKIFIQMVWVTVFVSASTLSCLLRWKLLAGVWLILSILLILAMLEQLALSRVINPDQQA